MFESAVANSKTMVGRVRVDITIRIDSFQEKKLQAEYPVQYMGTIRPLPRDTAFLWSKWTHFGRFFKLKNDTEQTVDKK